MGRALFPTVLLALIQAFFLSGGAHAVDKTAAHLPAPPAVHQFLEEPAPTPEVARSLGINTPEDINLYFQAHRARLLALHKATEKYWPELAAILQIDPTAENIDKLRTLSRGLLWIHDEAKMSPEVSAGLLKTFGENFNHLPKDHPKWQFISWINQRDSAIGNQYFENKNVSQGFREFCLVLEKIVDIEDRVRSPEAAIELNRPKFHADVFADHIFKGFAQKDLLIPFFKKVTHEIEPDYDRITQHLSFGEVRPIALRIKYQPRPAARIQSLQPLHQCMTQALASSLQAHTQPQTLRMAGP